MNEPPIAPVHRPLADGDSPSQPDTPPEAWVTAREVAEHLGVETSYVYEHAAKLGARRLGTGELARARTVRGPQPSDFVIATATGHKHSPSNLRRDVLAPAVEAANLELAKLGITPIGHITFHSLRRTYASLRCACGDDIRYAADQLGHEDPRFTLKVYAQAAKRRDRLNTTHRRAYDAALAWERMTNLTAGAITARGSRPRRNANR